MFSILEGIQTFIATMPLPDYIEVIYCKYSNDDHISQDPILLPCGSSACRQCYNPKIICSKCKTEHLMNVNDMKKHSLVNDLIKEYIEDLDKYIKQKLNNSFNMIGGK